ncbi:MAG TPA: hypothetical protein VGC79_28765 [Polyangiaceae bacterium]
MAAPASICLQRAVVGLLSSGLLLASHPALAQATADSSRSARADLLIEQGRALLNSGDVETACSKFEASEALENRVNTLLQLGDCYQRAGRSASAWHSFLEAEAFAHVAKDAAHAQVAAQRIAALEPKLIRIVFVVPVTSRVPGLTVRLGANTVPPRSWGSPIAVDAGVQRVSVSAKGYYSWAVDIDASHGEGQQYRVKVPTLSPTPSAESAASRGNGYRTAGVVTGSVGLAGIGAGAVFSALSRSANEASTCVKGVVQCTPSTSNKLIYTDAATVSFALGSALVATGVTLYVLAPSPDHKQENALRVAARYASSGGRLQLEGVW